MPAAVTRLAETTVDVELSLHPAAPPVGCDVLPQRRALERNALAERGTKRPVSFTSNTSEGPSASTAIWIGSFGEDEPCWIALVTASLIASFTS